MTAIPSHYAIRCPDCAGHMFVEGVLCPLCHGDGRLLIPERPQYHYTAKRALRIMFFVGIVIFGIVVLAGKG